MTTRTWQFAAAGQQHEVRLQYGGSRQRIWVDDVPRVPDADELNFTLTERPYPLHVEGCKCVLAVADTWRNEYALFVDGRWIAPLEDAHQNTAGRQYAYWLELAQQASLKEYAKAASGLPLVPLLIGEIDGFLCMVYVRRMIRQAPLVVFLLRAKPLAETSRLNREMQGLFTFWGIVRRTRWIHEVRVQAELVQLQYVLNPKKFPVQKLIQHVLSAARILAKYTRGPAGDTCEGRACRQRTGVHLELVLINGVPYRLCAACINDLASLGEEARKAYVGSPGNLGPGILAGLTAVLAVGLAWAMLTAIVNGLILYGAPVIYAGIFWAMRKAKTKPTLFSGVAAALLGIGGTILVSFLSLLGVGLRNSPLPLAYYLASAQRLMNLGIRYWHTMWRPGGLGLLSLLFALIFGALVFWLFGRYHRSALDRAFHPDIVTLSAEP